MVLTLLHAAAEGVHRGQEEHARRLIHRAGMLLSRTPRGAACFDRGLSDLARYVPGLTPVVAACRPMLPAAGPP